MVYLKFQDATSAVKATVEPISDNVVSISFADTIVVDKSGFHIYLDSAMDYDIGGTTYEKYTTIYRNDETTAENNGYMLSNNGSTYASPTPGITFKAGTGGSLIGETSQEVDRYEELIIPTPQPDEDYVFSGWNPELPTTGEVEESATYTAVFTYVEPISVTKSNKIAEMQEAQQTTIASGVDVTLTDGTVEHFTLKDQDQTSLMGLQTQVASGVEKIPWHTSDETEHCKYYSNADMALIVTAAMAYVTYHVTYFRDLRIYINSLTTKDEVSAITYGVYIPIEYQSEVLADLYAANGVADSTSEEGSEESIEETTDSTSDETVGEETSEATDE